MIKAKTAAGEQASERPRRPGERRPLPWLVVSLFLHATALAGLIVFAAIPTLPDRDETAVTVTLVPEALPSPPLPPVVSELRGPETEEPQRPSSPPPAVEGGMIAATRLRAADVLADPRSAGVRREMQTLAPNIRLEQLCNLEAMEQVHLWKPALSPDFVAAYAMDDTQTDSRTLKADGAAIRIADHWFRLRYACAATADIAAVTQFSFELGAEIPEAEWEEHGLLPGGGAMHE